MTSSYMAIPGYTSTEIAQIEERMRPKQMSAAGFLNFTENLLDVYNADMATLTTLAGGISCEQIGKCLLNYAIRASQMESDFPISKLKDELGEKKGYGLSGSNLLTFGTGTKINEDLVVFSCGWHGSQFCPFPCPPSLGDYKHSESSWTQHCPEGSSREYLVYNLAQKDYVIFSGLHSHLIKDHHFFEGHTSFRVDPERLIKVLNISATKNYDLGQVVKFMWSRSSSIKGCVYEFQLEQEKDLVWKLLDEEYQIFFGTNEDLKKDEMIFKILKPHSDWLAMEKVFRIGDHDFKVNPCQDRIGYTKIYYREYLLD